MYTCTYYIHVHVYSKCISLLHLLSELLHYCCAVSPVDQIYHLASPASPVKYMYNPIKTLKTNTIGTLNMLGTHTVHVHVHVVSGFHFDWGGGARWAIKAPPPRPDPSEVMYAYMYSLIN